MFIKDHEGYTAFDVYNSTVDGTKPLPDCHPRDPTDSSIARLLADLFTWGTNRNASLGLGDANDRTHPDQVPLRPLEASTSRQDRPNLDDLRPVQVLGIEMSKLHTTVITAETKSNVRSCGFASGGRLGPATASASHSQYALLPSQVGALPHQVVSVALGQDHTLALTSSGEVFSWGLNRFGQLGYVIEGKAAGDEPLQASARRVLGPLRSAIVIGVAASKSASACWTTTNLYTWGTNGGQFCACSIAIILRRLISVIGYDRPGQVQVQPRVVSPVAQPVAGVAMTDTATLVLLKTGDVLCLYDGMSWRLPCVQDGSCDAFR
jgi:alpha-tubulin suppressor-like RCC1 family protein